MSVLNARWRTLFAFGDSYSDSGAGYIDGDGQPAIVHFAQTLGIPFTHARALDAAGKGVNFAVSGARTGAAKGYFVRSVCAPPEAPEALLGRGITAQVGDFRARVAASAVHFDPKTTLFFIAGGLNDGPLQTGVTLDNLRVIVRDLVDSGARYLVLATLPVCVLQFRATAERLNPVIEQLIAELVGRYPAARFVLSRWGAHFDAVMADPGRFGIETIDGPCAGRALFGDDPTPSGRPDTYFFYHEGHPSAAVHRHVGLALARESRGWFVNSD